MHIRACAKIKVRVRPLLIGRSVPTLSAFLFHSALIVPVVVMSPSSDSSIVGSVREAWRRSFGFDSLQGRPVTGSHLLRIDGISAADRMVLVGEGVVSSGEFSAAGHRWQLSYYPNGQYSFDDGGPPIVSLMRKDRRHDKVTAEYSLSVLDRDGKPAFSYSSGRQRFESIWSSHRAEILATPEQRQAAMKLMGDDSLALRCDITVHTFHRESTIKRFLREILD
ncbi:hypothetical protein BS78_09G019400 [Paspalum vaginatum]|nr:hypothetical protein BS78_09G019400 [Paspalum vaginatum]